MTTSGWFVMMLSVIGMSTLMAWCIYKVMSTPGSTDHLHSVADIETPDLKDD